MNKEQEMKVWEYINKFNEQNAPKPGTRSCTQIFGWSKYLRKQPNGAIILSHSRKTSTVKKSYLTWNIFPLNKCSPILIFTPANKD